MTTLAPAPARSVPFARELASWGERVALVTPDGPLSYRELADRVDRVAARLGPRRRLVLVVAATALDPVVGYLAALAGGHPVLLAPPGDPAALAGLLEAYDPDVVVRDGSLLERRPGSRHDLHPELALLLSTSGSTGSPKLVRLSTRNVQANAEAIASYLDIRDTDRAATTLPLHYCYGLSVLNSGLVRGASLLLTDRSVTDPEFWELFRAHRCTSLAGVPYTFELLDRVGFAGMDLPQLRYVTQAGGRLDPDRVRRYAELGRARGWDLVVMYGQTEATARMAYLPPRFAADRPECIGRPVPGGDFRLEPLADRPEPDVGELVYTGPNVMLGYARAAADLALGRTVHELHTGDIARRHPDGLYQVVGRRSRFAKVFGLRIDLDRVEAALAERGLTACCLARDEELVVAVAGGDDARRLAAEASGLPRNAVRLVPVPAIPRLASGKPDLVAVAALAGDGAGGAGAAGKGAGAGATDLRRLFAEMLDCDEVTEDSTFAGLGGDSLSYVRMSIRLEELLGPLPEDWPTRPVRELRALAGRPRRRGRWLETSVALRAVAIVLVVGTHATAIDLPGGAHLLLAVLGFNLARFQLTAAGRWERLRGLGRCLQRIAAPSILWATLAVLLLGQYTLTHAVMLTYVLGPPGHNDFWFVETALWLVAGVTALLALPAVDRLERRHPLALPLGIAALGLLTRYGLVPGAYPTPVKVIWLLALGWAAARAATVPQRLGLTAAAVATIPGFHGDPSRELLMIAGYALLVWVPAVPSLPALSRVAGVLAASSLHIYLTHWLVYRSLADSSPVLAWVASLLVGIGYAALLAAAARSARTAGAATRLRRAVRRPPSPRRP